MYIKNIGEITRDLGAFCSNKENIKRNKRAKKKTNISEKPMLLRVVAFEAGSSAAFPRFFRAHCFPGSSSHRGPITSLRPGGCSLVPFCPSIGYFLFLNLFFSRSGHCALTTSPNVAREKPSCTGRLDSTLLASIPLDVSATLPYLTKRDSFWVS